MQDIIRGDARIIEDISALCTDSDAIHHSIDSFGNAFHWFRLDTPRQLPQAAAILRKTGDAPGHGHGLQPPPAESSP